MQAVVYTQYGTPDVLRLQTIEKPTPADDEVLVRVHAVSINAADWHLLTADIFLIRLIGGLLRPKHKILGADIAGRVEATGSQVTQFQPGDEVYGDLSSCGWGGMAEYVAVPAHALAAKPAGLTFEQAAAVPLAGLTALQGLRDVGQIERGKKVLIQGASGGVGTFAVQLARWFGAEVTAVCSTSKIEMVRGLGADHVIDYTREDFTRSGQQYDLILGVNGYHPLAAYKRSLSPQGIYVMAGGKPAQMFEALLLSGWMSRGGGRKLKTLSAKPDPQDLAFMSELLEAGHIVPVVDRCYPLSEAADAMRHLGEGHARGKVVITVPG